MPRRTLLCRLAAALHVALGIAFAVMVVSLDLDAPLRALIAVIALAPAAFTLPGLMAGRPEALRWLAVLLVLYAGLGAVEVVARGHPAAAGVLLFALIELALVLSLTRLPPPQGPRAAGES